MKDKKFVKSAKMCDTTSFISANQTDLHSCWIIYTKSDGKERLTVTDARPVHTDNTIPSNTSFPEATSDENHFLNQTLTTSTVDNDDDDSTNSDNDDMLVPDMLENPELQPEKPLPYNALSQHIYKEHRRLTKEYCKTETKLYYAQDFKKKFILQIQDPNERIQKEEILKKMNDKQELLELFNNLKQQWRNAGVMTSSANSNNPTSQPNNYERVADDGWVFVAPGENS